MRRPATSIALALVAAALFAAGCGESSPSAEPQPPPPPPTAPPAPPPPAAPSPSFKKGDLARIALGPKNAPPGLVYVKEESGPMALEEIFVLPRQAREARALGSVGVHDSIFAARAARSDLRVSQRIWLFKTRAGAKTWFDKTKEDLTARQFTEVEAPLLGDESWAASGLIQVAGGQAISHAFRLGNTVQVISTYGEVTPPLEEGALAAAQAALAKARKG